MEMDPHASSGADPGANKIRQQSMWADGDYGRIGMTLQGVAERLAERLDLCPGERVIDVASGSGNFTLAAARRRTRATAIDFVTSLLSRGRARARAEGLDADFRLADAEDLPFADDSFDVAGSTFGVIYACDPRRAAAEIVRVTRPGGRIGLAVWAPDGFVGQLREAITRSVPCRAGSPSLDAWESREQLERLFGERAETVEVRSREFVLRDYTPAAWLERLRQDHGPIKHAFASIDARARGELAAEIESLIARFDTGVGFMRIPATYLEALISLRDGVPSISGRLKGVSNPGCCQSADDLQTTSRLPLPKRPRVRKPNERVPFENAEE